MTNRDTAHGPWHTLNLGDASLAAARLEQVRERFAAASEAGLPDPQRAIFVRHESEGRLHCEAILYFPPPLAELAEEFGARLCAQPTPTGLGLFAGPQSAWWGYFPGRSDP